VRPWMRIDNAKCIQRTQHRSSFSSPSPSSRPTTRCSWRGPLPTYVARAILLRARATQLNAGPLDGERETPDCFDRLARGHRLPCSCRARRSSASVAVSGGRRHFRPADPSLPLGNSSLFLGRGGGGAFVARLCRCGVLRTSTVVRHSLLAVSRARSLPGGNRRQSTRRLTKRCSCRGPLPTVFARAILLRARATQLNAGPLATG
jgi:hypothetical protein